MFNIVEQCNKAGMALLETQLAGFHALAASCFDGGLLLAERQADALRGSLATGTVAAKQWMTMPCRDAQ